MQKLIELFSGLGSPHVVLVGDFMLDRWVYGDTERLSQEAPVPVLKVLRSQERAGGAGNVATAILALGGKVSCIGVTGTDDVGFNLVSLLNESGADTAGLLRMADRPTTVKTRYVGLAQHKNEQQILRVDSEYTDPLPEAIRGTLKGSISALLKDSPVIAIQDHNKGVLNATDTPKIISQAREAGGQVVVDPALIDDYSRYRGATLLTPNRYEASLASGVTISDASSLEAAAEKIMNITQADVVMVTLDKGGIFILSARGSVHRLPPCPRSVYDGTGAGDAVLASLAVALGAGWDIDSSADLANVVGGLEVEKFGVVPISRQETADELQRMVGLRGDKVVRREVLFEELARRKAKGETIVFTNGCFDLLHIGHLRYLRQARKLGACLVVAINSDDSVRRLKGANRPIIGQDERAEMLGSLECVDYVTIFDEDTPIPLLQMLKPDLLAKGGTTSDVVGRDVVEGYGGQVLTLDLVEGLSTTEIINRIVSNNQAS